MQSTLVSLSDVLPLTCSRSGSCCHGNYVKLNPWELARLAHEKRMDIKSFQKQYTEAGGSVLRFQGKPNHRGKKACNLYVENEGCSVHSGRPLACRLFPLGRQLQNQEANYIFPGNTFPCLIECPEVNDLPKLTVSNYLKGQETALFELAQDEYMEVMQNLADVAFTLLLETGLAQNGSYNTLQDWLKLGALTPLELTKQFEPRWLDLLMVPELHADLSDPKAFAQEHNEILQIQIQEVFGAFSEMKYIHEASIQLMAMTLFLAKTLGADAPSLVEFWIEIAKENGANELFEK